MHVGMPGDALLGASTSAACVLHPRFCLLCADIFHLAVSNLMSVGISVATSEIG